MAITEQTFSADGNLPNDGGVPFDGEVYNGKFTVWAEGTFGGGTLTLEFKPQGATNWQAVTDGTLTDDGQFNCEITGPCKMRLALSGSTAPTLRAGVSS